MFYTTLKENRKNNVDIINDVDECFFQIGSILNETYNTNKYLDKSDYSDWEKIENDFDKNKLESITLKYLKKYANNHDEMYILRYKKYLFDTLFLYDDVEMLLKNHELIKSDIDNIEKLCKKYGVKVEKEIVDENGYYSYNNLSDLRNIYFPCNFNIHGDCINCDNCK